MEESLVHEFFRAADARDPQAQGQLLTDDVVWTFGNMPTLRGRVAVMSTLATFFKHVVDMSHRVVGLWRCGECRTVEVRVRYRDQFGRTFEFPACILLFARDTLIHEVRVFVDNHELFLPPPN
jgi:ketosteroid isomerase-like protein